METVAVIRAGFVSWWWGEQPIGRRLVVVLPWLASAACKVLRVRLNQIIVARHVLQGWR